MKIFIRKPYSFSEIGRKDCQEDRIYPKPEDVKDDQQVFVLCDGMGGHENGEVASETVAVALGKYLDEHLSHEGMSANDIFTEALNYAYDELDKKDTGAAKKMGTTMTCLYLHSKGYLVAHIGDSRIYHVRPSQTDIANNRLGIIYQSSDHSLVNDLLRVGELTEEEAINFPQKNVITRAMQPYLEKRHKADVYSFNDIKAGDYFFLCCDGVLEQLTNERLCEIISDESLDDKGKLAAIKEVCDGKTKDNYTCWLIPIDAVVDNADITDTHDEIIQAIEVDEETTDPPQTIVNVNTITPKQKVKPQKRANSQNKGKVDLETILKDILTEVWVRCKNRKWAYIVAMVSALLIAVILLFVFTHSPKEQADDAVAPIIEISKDSLKTV